MDNKGITLIAIIMLIVLLAIVVGGITSYITEILGFNVSSINNTKALYMAQAGVMRGLMDYLDNGFWNAVQNNNDVGGEFYYHVGKNANFLWVDTFSPRLSGKQLKRIPIRNLHAASSITITNMTVSWTFGGNITNVTLGNTVVWTGTASSPASLDITDLTLAQGAYYSNTNHQIWEFSSNVPNDTSSDVVVTFIFSDGSSHKAYLLKAGKGANKEFSLTATGEIRKGATVEARRTLVATYDTGTSKITSWQESTSHIIP